MSKFEKFLIRAEETSQIIKNNIIANKNTIIIGHKDTDGIISSSILAKSILGEKGRVTIRTLSSLTSDYIKQLKDSKYDFYVFTDIGSDLIEEFELHLKNKWFIIDHHKMKNEYLNHNNVFNSWHCDYDGNYEISSSGLSYFVSLSLNKLNQTLCFLPIVGAISDKQERGKDRSLTGINNKIIDEAKENGFIGEKNDLTLCNKENQPIHVALSSSLNPYLPGITGNTSNALKLLSSLDFKIKEKNVWRTISNLTLDEKTMLVKGIYDYIGYENNDISGLFGINYFSLTENQHSDLYDVNHFSELINCCAIMDKPSYAIILCMGDYGEALLNVKNVFLQCSQILINKLNLILGDKTRVIDKGDLLLVICDNLIEDNALNFLSSMIISIPYYNNKIVIVKNSNITGYNKLIIRQNHLSPNKNLLDLLNKIKSNISLHGNDCVVSCTMKSDYYETFIKNVEEVLI